LAQIARGSLGKCFTHGGGKLCEEPNCEKSAQTSGRCIAHGGGKKCDAPGCVKFARGATGKCFSHGGGKKCEEVKDVRHMLAKVTTRDLLQSSTITHRQSLV